MKVKKCIKCIIKNSFICKKIANICNEYSYGSICYGQNAEDMIAEKFFDTNYKGFYVDIGAHHPQRFSNTYSFYQKGWRGINIDPLPGSMTHFEKERNEDINLEICVSADSGIVKYYLFDEPAYNTISEERAEKVLSLNVTRLKNIIDIQSKPLADLLDRYVPKGKSIDLMSIDVESMELPVLMTNNWEKFLPKLIIIESLISTYGDIYMVKNDPAIRFLVGIGYEIVGKVLNVVYLKYKK
ncbi:FkbM family methyltransferase [Desulfovibrio fairfieldensis]|uniref:FkbM family methyltransferase n=1 Tax=Desulfovibrio fairfieldensis TaxID=44742 RepID=UPI0009FB50F3|nr:FkbM family methyltransferase [Desulfovibrio fairfieldensis]